VRAVELDPFAVETDRRVHRDPVVLYGQRSANSLRAEDTAMVIGVAHLSPILSIVFGILILVLPRLLNYLVGIYLILAGLLGLGIIR